MLAYAPLFPHPKEEKWTFIVADAANNTVFNRQEIALIEAEAGGISHPVRRPHHILTATQSRAKVKTLNTLPHCCPSPDDHWRDIVGMPSRLQLPRLEA